MAAGRIHLVKFCNVKSPKNLYRCMCTTASKTEEYYKKRATKLVDKILRVDHAGEFGADRIYAGQIAVLGKNGPTGELIQVISVLRCS